MTLHLIFNIVIILIIILLLFFLMKWFYGKIKYFKEKKLLKNILAVISSIVLYFLISTILFSIITRTPKSNFDEVVWKNNINERHKMIDDLLQSNYFIGKNKDNIESIFGEPLNIDIENKIIEYELIGRTWSEFRIIKLKLYLENDIVYKSEFKERK